MYERVVPFSRVLLLIITENEEVPVEINQELMSLINERSFTFIWIDLIGIEFEKENIYSTYEILNVGFKNQNGSFLCDLHLQSCVEVSRVELAMDPGRIVNNLAWASTSSLTVCWAY